MIHCASRQRPLWLILFAAWLPTCTGQQPPPADGRLAPLLEGMGAHRLAISTAEPMAQRYFDQGLALAYGFNHAEAERSFREAARLDPGCAMCFWGVALVLGPNYNAGMEDEAVRGEHAAAVAHLERGVTLEDALNYDEPPPWHAPVRHNLGAVLLAAGDAAAAERVFRRDLERNPENGWALAGLAASLAAQERGGEAAAVSERLDRAWARADVEPPMPRLQ